VDLDAYLQRIGIPRRCAPDLAFLRRMHRAHLRTIPYENLDVLLGRELSVDGDRAFDKLVRGNRGGWCFEMNALFAGALEAAGYRVRTWAAVIKRDRWNRSEEGVHPLLRIDLDQPYLADVGFGDGLREPIPLRSGLHRQGKLNFWLEPLDSEWWRLHNHANASIPYYDFTLEPVDRARLIAASEWMRTSSASPHLRNAVCQRHLDGGIVLLLGRGLCRLQGQRTTVRLLDGAEAYVASLRRVFGIVCPEAAALWPRICAQHEKVVAEATSRATGNTGRARLKDGG
jgi:N-hydroxyarylamine O-acetyltransferase